MTITNGGTILVGSCTIGGITNLSVVAGTVTATGANVTFGGTCTSGPSTTSVATLSPTTQNFIIGTTTATTPITVSSSDSGVTCTLTDSNGLTSAAVGITQSIPVAVPTAAGTFTYTARCTSSTSGITAVTPVPASVTVVASTTPPPPPPPNNTCDATQTSTYFGAVQLTRQCSGTVTFGAYHSAYNGNLYNLVDILGDKTHPGPFPNLISGYTMVMPINTGKFVSLKFNATNSGQMQFTADPSYGNADFISISTQPGDFNGSSVVRGTYGACSYNYNSSNSMWIGMGGADCPLVQGQDYYINFAGVDANGTQQCFNSAPGSCASEKLSYQVVSSH